jgi:iron complex transport system permease protein
VGVLLGLGLGEWLDWPGWIDTPVMAMVGALATSGVVYGVAQRRGRLDPYVLLLSGVIVNVLNGAIIYAILLFLRPNQLLSFIGWGMGRVPDSLWVQPDLVIFCAVWVVGGWAVLMFRGSAFNALALGDEVAASVGVPVHWLRVETFVVVSLMTAAAVALAGPIGFLGLIVPHLCRLAVGPDHRLLAVVCGFAGAIFLMVADTFCRTAGEWFHVAEIPVGIFTAFCGGPFFILLLRRRHREKAA